MEKSPSSPPRPPQTSIVLKGVDTDIGRLSRTQFARYQAVKNSVWHFLISDPDIKKNCINMCRASRKITKMVMEGTPLETAMDIYRSRIQSIQN